MNLTDTLAFVVYPYIALTVFVTGHSYRYLTDRYHWNSRSSELIDKGGHRYGVIIFHVGIIFTFLGHFFGLLTPQDWLDQIGITAQMHDAVAIGSGMLIGAVALIGLIMVLWRRSTRPRVYATSSVNDFVVLALLFTVIVPGVYNTFFPGTEVLYTVAPWIRGIVTFRPDPSLLSGVPWTYKIHILAALTVLGYSPFSRLVHIWSLPATYLIRPHITFRRRVVPGV
jgi:nitrate reductase gamma subunit